VTNVKLNYNGRFEFFLSQIEGREGDRQLELVIVRRGGNDTEASVDFKAVSVSAAYGADYTLSVDGSAFSKKVLESSVDTDTLTESYGKEAVQTENGEMSVSITEEANAEG